MLLLVRPTGIEPVVVRYFLMFSNRNYQKIPVKINMLIFSNQIKSIKIGNIERQLNVKINLFNCMYMVPKRYPILFYPNSNFPVLPVFLGILNLLKSRGFHCIKTEVLIW